ncbi:MAG: hypothetical protein ABFD12_11955 [Syntrophorhabdus sp.]
MKIIILYYIDDEVRTMTREKMTEHAIELMKDFAELTGLSPAGKFSKRYLWTDAYAVCNYLGLYQETGNVQYRNLALRLVDEVHSHLGRHRKDSPHKGWLSGLPDPEGKKHPTAGGLRIGKSLPERGPKDPLDERKEWDRDGQYYHYLTKWMHALNCMTVVTGDFTFNRWAIELMKAAHQGFVYTVEMTGIKRMYWKMSTDLTYPLVPSMGQHDPLDGLITAMQLYGTGLNDPDQSPSLDLQAEITDLVEICEGRDWETDDLLGLGGLLCDAYRVARLFQKGVLEGSDMLRIILNASLPGLKYPGRENFLYTPARFRLAFRELGLSIGFHALERLDALISANIPVFKDDRDISVLLKTLGKYLSLGQKIEDFWLEPLNRKSEAWKEHRDINIVMLVTSLLPDGFLAM